MNEFVQYWVNQDGVQAGPVTRDEMAAMSLTSSAYVWRSGLEDWVKITQLPELEGVYRLIPPVVPVESTASEINSDEQTPTATDEGENEQEVVVGEPVAPVMGEPVAPVMGEPIGQPQQPQQPQPAQPPMLPQQAANVPECPPTNLVWAVLTTILCCIPFGIIAIVYANKVSRLYYEGDLAGAQRASETSAWWCIGAIMAGIIFQPILSLIQLATM